MSTKPGAVPWNRLAGFEPEELVTLMQERAVVRVSLLRGTIHLVTADDALGIHPLMRDVHRRILASNQTVASLRASVDLDALAAAGHRLLSARPMTGADLGAALAPEFPPHSPTVLARAVRDLLAGVQVPPRGIWGQGGKPVTTTAEAWLGRPLKAYPIDSLVLRYLAAFGPASVADMQAWSGLTRLAEVFDRLKLRSYVDESGRELYDLQSVELPDPDTPAPVRFIAEYDNLLLGHADRTRVLSEAHRRQVFTVNGIVKGTVLYDGFVVATYKATANRNTARVVIEPLERIPRAGRQEILTEADRLLTFLARDAEVRDAVLGSPQELSSDEI